MDFRLAVPAAAAWLATVLILPLREAMVPFALTCWAVGGVLLAAAVVRRLPRLVLVAVATAAIALVVTSAVVHSPFRRTTELSTAASSGATVEITVVTTQSVDDGPFGATAADGTGAAAPLLIFDGAPEQGTGAGVGIGSTLTVRGTLTETAPEDDVSYLFFASEPGDLVAGPPGFLGWTESLRSGFLLLAGDLPGDGGSLLPGLAIGDTRAVSDELDLAMKASSLSHLTAVSGANCAVIIGLILLAGAALGLGRTWRVAASLAVLAGFVVLVTPEPSVLRAAVMATLALLAYAAGRPVQGIPVLAGAVLVLLVLDPWLARSYGFALSVLATGGLLLLTGPLTRLLSRWIPLWLAVAVAVPLAAQLACQPVLVLLNPEIPLFGIIANILAGPAAPAATVVGLAACLIGPIAPAVGGALAAIAWVFAAWIGAVARFFGAITWARFEWPGGVLGALALGAATALVLGIVLLPLPPPVLRVGRFAAVLLIVVAVAASGGTSIAGQAGRPTEWQIAACDIGQGDAMVVRSAGKIAVMDTGPDPVLLRECLDTLGIDRIDILFLSHFDLDHIGGTDAVVGRVDRALVGVIAEPADEAVIRSLVAGGAQVEQVSQGPVGLLGDLRWKILWPPNPLGEIEPGNPASMTVRFDPVGTCAAGCLSSLFVGDLDERSQNRMLAANPGFTPVDVVKVSHHGSADQSVRLYETIAARVGLIGVGVGNGYGHPTERLLGILRDTRTEAARTDTDGLVLVAPGSTPGSITLWRQRDREQRDSERVPGDAGD